MSDNEDLLADDIGDQSLADYNLGNEEEEQLLADDFESGSSQNVPSSVNSYEVIDMGPTDYSSHETAYQPMICHIEPERVVPNITVEVASTYAPYEPRNAVVPPPIPAIPAESPQIVPTDPAVLPPDDTMGGPRERFISERPPGAQRMPQVRDIPDTLDKVVVPTGYSPRARQWQPHYRHNRFNNPYRRNNMQRGNFNQRPSFPPPNRQHAPPLRPDIRPSPPQIPDFRPDLPPMNQEMQERPQMMPNAMPNMRQEQFQMERPIRPMERPQMDLRPQFRPQFLFRPNLEEPGPFQPNMRPNFERPMFQFQRPGFRPFGPPMREVTPNMAHLPQVTIRHHLPPGPQQNQPPGPMNHPLGPMNRLPGPMGHPPSPQNLPPGMREPEVRMLPVLPPILPPGGLAGKKVLINPHFKGNFTPVDGLPLPTYIPTRIQRSPPTSPTIENKLGPIKDIDDAAERFIAEQRNALARAANRKFQRRSPQRYIENTRIEIENDLARPPPPPRQEDDLLRRQEEFISANRARLRRMRSPSPARRSPSPRRSPERARVRVDTNRTQPPDEETDYRRRMREQESLRERVLRAKEARRRKNAVAHKQGERERAEKEKEQARPVKPPVKQPDVDQVKPDTTRKSPEKVPVVERERSPVRPEEAEVNSTCENLTPPREDLPKSPERDLTPPLPVKEKEEASAKEKRLMESDDDLDLILDDIDDILSDDDDSGRFKEKTKKPEPPKPKSVDLRSKLPPKAENKPPRQKIVFHDKKEKEEREQREKEKERDRKRKEKSPVRKTQVSSSTKTEDSADKKSTKAKEKVESTKEAKSRPRIIFDNKDKEAAAGQKAKDQEESKQQQPFSNRRVILQRKVTAQAKVTAQPKEKSVFTRIEVANDPTKPHPGIFSRAVRTVIGSGTEKSRIITKREEPDIPVEYESESSVDEDTLLEDEVGISALVTNLPHGMTDTRLKTLAGDAVQSLILDKEERSAKVTFKTSVAAESFKRKFNNKMVAASRLTVTLR